LHHQLVDIARVAFDDRRCVRQLAYVADRVVTVERLKMVLERLPADRNSFLNDERGFDRAERLPSIALEV